MEKQNLERIERHIFAVFRDRRKAKLLAKEILKSTDEFANADLVRALEDLEKTWRLVVRYTNDGDDWVSLTREGAVHAKLDQSEVDLQPQALPHPPKSAPRKK